MWVLAFIMGWSDIIQNFAEYYGWWGDSKAQHISHLGLAAIWFCIAVLFHKVDR